jgi:integrase
MEAGHATLSAAMPSQKRGKSMTRRSGQSGTVVRKGNRWYGRFYQDVVGQEKRRYVSVPLGLVKQKGKSEGMTESEAKRKLRSLLENLGLNSMETFTRIVQPGPTFREVAEWWKEHKLSMCAPSYQETRGAYLETHLLRFFGSRPVCVIGEQLAQEFITHLTRRNLAPATIVSIVSTLKAILGAKVTRDWRLGLPKSNGAEQRFFTRDEMRNIIDAATGKWKVLFALLSETGLRCGEAFGLHAEDLDMTGCRVYVRRSVYKGQETPTKTRAGVRVVNISPEVAKLLEKHLAQRTTGRVFETRNGTALSKDNARRKLQSILRKLGIPKGGLHSFRHGRVSLLQAAGVPSDLVKRWVGHTRETMTSHYTHFEEEYMQEVAKRLGIFSNAPNAPNFAPMVTGNEPLQATTA